ncbi:nitrite/sulfite reductase [Bermanella marisrubri]|uniref:Sulfite reductase, beta subunit (Hemoprotein) n=1 Tax=Bermanella marisrubri TaxID=207949 RepID=Q1MXY1_9GAMM|nr:nitrite/sulfite reductase [Bermanella marisrubri]EAT10848.1 Sulfite reductase, beta subunit (hemoprotein) [Oceanobacter sp. RED65] [Bermanella marisrubri]QIZ84229.1 nitrite/sulfite reductase [Bermanella marisrubri]
MYIYDEYDQKIVNERVSQFRDQTQRYLDGKLTEEQFLPLRLQNGLYVQRYAPMLRVAVPYGLLSSEQARKLGHIARTYDKGYAHISTRTNVQFNWPELAAVPDILAELASVQMHAIQTSGNCIRNTTTDQFAGVVPNELVDPRPYCEIIRQWSTFHPEFAFLPRKFKIAVNSHESDDRAATLLHDIGIKIVRNEQGELGYAFYVGGGLGRTPIVASLVKEFVAEKDLLTYLDAVLRVYNLHGRRDNKYKARIKILVKALGVDAFRDKVDAEWQHLKGGPGTLTQEELERVKGHFTAPNYETLDENTELQKQLSENKAFANWYNRNVNEHKVKGYAIVTLTLKKLGVPPGDITDRQFDSVADLADKYSFGEIRNTHEQNMVLADVKQDDLFELWQQAKELGFATPNLGLLTDMICCPGGDFCALANAKSIPVAEALQAKFDDLDYLHDLGDLDLNISGCMNACGHHHIGHIGILGVDKKGEEFYQVSLGGSSGPDASVGKILGPSFAREEMPDVIEKVLSVYVRNRIEGERFIDTYRRIGHSPFKEFVYAKSH